MRVTDDTLAAQYAAARATLHRERVSRATGTVDKRGRLIVRHPTLWFWRDEIGDERAHDTRTEALDAIAARYVP